MYLYRIAVLL